MLGNRCALFAGVVDDFRALRYAIPGLANDASVDGDLSSFDGGLCLATGGEIGALSEPLIEAAEVGIGGQSEHAAYYRGRTPWARYRRRVSSEYKRMIGGWLRCVSPC